MVMCDLDARFFSSSNVFSAFLHIDEALGISFAESFLREQRVMMMQAERCAFERFACEQVLVSPEGEETYPAFFFDELLSFYEKEGEKSIYSIICLSKKKVKVLHFVRKLPAKVKSYLCSLFQKLFGECFLKTQNPISFFRVLSFITASPYRP